MRHLGKDGLARVRHREHCFTTVSLAFLTAQIKLGGSTMKINRLIRIHCLIRLAFAATVSLPLVLPVQAQTMSSASSPTAAMTFADGSSLSTRCKEDRFPIIAALGGQTVNIQLRFPTTAALSRLIIEPLDGGSLISGQSETSIAADGAVSIQFQPGNGPGLYRILLNQAGSIFTLRFWVADPQQPNSGPPALQPK
jgi:hypothetical protein